MTDPEHTITTFETAKLCPKCGQAGDDRAQKPAQNARGQMITVHIIYCVTELCPWFGTPWFVNINPDGSVPQAYQQLGDKHFPKISQESMTRVEESILRQLEQETKQGGHGEVRNPRG